MGNIWLLLILISVFFSDGVFGKTLLCQQIVDKQLCDKIGQMLIIGFGGFNQDESSGKVLWNDQDGTKFNKRSVIAKHIANNHIGGIILFTKPARDVKTGKFIRDRNIQNPVQVAELNKSLQNYNNQVQKEQGLELLPLFTSVDQEGGRIDRLPAIQGFPVATLLPQALGAKEEISKKGSSRKDAIKETYVYAKKIAQEIADAHFNLNFAPVVDIDINPTNPIIGGLGRSFSSHPGVVVDQAKQFIRAFHESKIISTLKHFPGHGSSSGDSHLGLVDVTSSYKKLKNYILIHA